jgi:VWFA-related protein
MLFSNSKFFETVRSFGQTGPVDCYRKLRRGKMENRMKNQRSRIEGMLRNSRALRVLLTVPILLFPSPCSHSQTNPGNPSTAVSPMAAGAPTAANTASQTPNLTLPADEVSLDLVVHDKKKKLVPDLKPTDLAITDNGTPVVLNNLHLVTGADAGHMITMVFDPMEGANGKNAEDIANKVLKMVPKSGFSLAVLSLGSRLRLVQGFTSDTKAVQEAVEVATQEGPVQQAIAIGAAEKTLMSEAQKGVDASGKMESITERAKARTLLAALEGSQRIIQDQHAGASLAGLLALARSQQSLMERKTIIYFSLKGQQDEDAGAMVQTIIGAANRANLSIYSVDMNGIGQETHNQLMTMMVMGNMAGANPIPTPGQGQAGDPAGPGAGTFIANNSTRYEGQGLEDNKNPLVRLAVNTGGAYIDGQDSVKKPLVQMFQDMTTYYQASYVPPVQDYDGSFREIAVKPLRVGLTVRSKSGYFSLPSGGADGIRPFEAPLLKILSDPQLPSDLNFHASILRLGDLPDGNTNTLVIETPLSELEIKEDPNTNLYSAHLSIVAQIKDKNGTVIEHFGEDVPRHGALESVERAKSEFITLQRHFIAVPGEYVLEAVVMDRNNGNAGAQRIKFEVPQPAEGPSLSDVVLVRRMETYRDEVDPDEPMRYGNGKVTANLSGQLPLDAKTVSMFFILHPDPKIAEQPKLEMTVLRDGKPAGKTTLPLSQGAVAGAVPYLATIQAGSLSSGHYEVIAQITQGGKEAENDVAFSVTGSRPAATASNSGAAAIEADANFQVPASKPVNASHLVIAVPDKAVPAPAPEELQAIIADARKRAVSYADGLPNFMCVEVTNRLVAPKGEGRWKHRDTVIELLRYRDKSETRTLVNVDGKPVTGDSESLKGAHSVGEFGGVLSAIFQDSSKADFKWKETDTLGSGTVQVFSYSVAHDNSDFKVTGVGNDQVTVGFHGEVFIDGATASVRRATLVADDLPRDFSIHATSISVDYDYVVINAHDYLMPIAGEVNLQQGRRQAVLNQFELRDYRRFGSNIRILGFTPLVKP